MTVGASKRRARQRQDLHTVPLVEREMNDISADDLYEQTLLGHVRAGTNPNALEEVDDYEGYVEPSFDPIQAAKVAAAHRTAIHDIYKEREDIIRTLRSSEEHMQLSAFDQLLTETEYYTGMREWHPASGKSSQLFRRRAARSDGDGEDPSGLDTVRLTETPSYIKGQLRPYQLEGVNWLLGLFSRGVNGILADEMGLGKTFQTIATLAYLKFTVGMPGPHLVVCPKSVMGNWYREVKHWCPALSVYKFHASSAVRHNIVKAHLQPYDRIRYDIVITTFEMVMDEISSFKRISWQYLIVDEAHKLKNEESRAHVLLDSLNTSHRLIITGTPLQNNLKELWALLHFLAPHLFSDADSFDKWFDTSAGQQDEAVMSNMHKILSPLMIRRLKSDVNTGIPPKKEIYVSCQLTKKQREWYMNVLARDAEALNKNSTTGSSAKLSNVLINLRKVINHPYLMDGGEEGPPFVTDEKIVKSSGKMIILDMLLRRLKGDVEGRHKVLIFSQFTMMLDVLEDFLNMRGHKYCRIDGNTSGYERDTQMAAFNSPNSEYFVFLLSTRAGGLGINLQAANHVVIYDSDWNPQMDLQAQDRAHRIGQKRSVRVYRFVTDGTVEEKIYRRALKKLYLDAVVVQQGRLQTKSANQVSKEELLSMIKFGAEEIFKSRQEDVTEADIDRLLDEGEKRSNALVSEAQQQVQMSLASFQLGAEEANIYDFEGVSYKPGVESRMLHVRLPEPVSQADLHAQCSLYGEVLKTVLHPNLKEALVYFRSTSGASEARKSLPYESSFASRDAQTVVTSEMVSECLTVGEKLGRGHRTREIVQPFTGDDALSSSRAEKLPPPKLPKEPRYPAHQLFNTKRLLELHKAEVAALLRNWRLKCSRVGKEDENKEGDADEGMEDTLTTVELEERERLLDEGFANWTAAEYRALRGALLAGAAEDDYETLTAAVQGAAAVDAEPKTTGEVRDYTRALMERGEQCIAGFSRFEHHMKVAQNRRRARELQREAAMWKVERCPNPERNLTFRVKGGNATFDRQLFLQAYKVQFNLDAFSGETVLALPENRFDIWSQSRTSDYWSHRLWRLLHEARREWDKEQAGGDDENGSPTHRRRVE